jgi:hypothetical protein
MESLCLYYGWIGCQFGAFLHYPCFRQGITKHNEQGVPRGYERVLEGMFIYTLFEVAIGSFWQLLWGLEILGCVPRSTTWGQ